MTPSTNTEQLVSVLDQFLVVLVNGQGYAHNTISAYRNDLMQLIEYVVQQHPSIDRWSLVTPEILANFAEHLRTMNVSKRGGGEAKPAAASTIARKVAALKSFFSYLVKANLASVDASAGLEAPRVAKRSPKTLSNEDMARLLAAPGTGNSPKVLRDRSLLELLYATGMRVSELVSLQVDDLNLVDRSVRVQNGESNKERQVPFDEHTAQALGVYLDRGRPALLKEGGDRAALFLNQRGQKLTRQGMWLIIKEYAARAGIAYVTPHVLRHSFAAHMLESNRASLSELQHFLGHANISTTQIYKQLPRSASAADEEANKHSAE